MRRTLSLAALIVLAGCLGGAGADSRMASDSPPNAVWADGDGINATALARQHFEVVREAGSFTVNHSEVVRVGGKPRPDSPRPEGYTPPSFVRQQVDLDSGTYRARQVVVGHRRSAHFITPEVTAWRRASCPDCALEYSYQQRPDSDTLSKRLNRFRTGTAVERLNRTLRGVTVGFEYTRTQTLKRDGDVLYRYRAERTLGSAPPPFAEPPHGTATILVTDEGVIRQFTLKYSGVTSVEGETRTVPVTQTFTWTYTAVGTTTVERPSWVDQAASEDSPRTTRTGEQ